MYIPSTTHTHTKLCPPELAQRKQNCEASHTQTASRKSQGQFLFLYLFEFFIAINCRLHNPPVSTAINDLLTNSPMESSGSTVRGALYNWWSAATDRLSLLSSYYQPGWSWKAGALNSVRAGNSLHYFIRCWKLSHLQRGTKGVWSPGMLIIQQESESISTVRTENLVRSCI